MSLRDKLLALRAAARSFSGSSDPSECVALVREGHPYDHLFFTELSDPQWLPTLKQAGFFSRLPSRELRADGSVSYSHHLPLFGLKRVGQSAPHQVVEILEELQVPNNPVIGDQIMLVIAAVGEAEFARRLFFVLRRIVRTGGALSTRALDDILTRWLRSGETSVCIDTIDLYFVAVVSNAHPEESLFLGTGIRSLDQRVVANLAEIEPLAVAEVIFSALRTWAANERTKIQDAKEDRPQHGADEESPRTYWLERFGKASIASHDFEETLAHRLYAVGRQLFTGGDKRDIARFDSMLRNDSWQLFRRLRCQLYADFPDVSLELARDEALALLPQLSRAIERHSFELASMLEVHSERHGNSFLNEAEVGKFVEAVLAGPINREEQLDTDYLPRFRRLQIYPIRRLVDPKQMEAIDAAAGGPADIPLDAFKPFSVGPVMSIERKPPAVAAEMESMPDDEIWNMLNNWKPNARKGPESWIEEDAGALADKFAQLLERNPDRFRPERRWWENLHRGVVLRTLLERASERISKKTVNGAPAEPTASEWQNWFGIAEWTFTQSVAMQVMENAEDVGIPSNQRDWNYTQVVVIRFLKAALASEPPILPPLFATAGRLLNELFNVPDILLAAKDRPAIDDWLTTAINSVRGTALEGLLKVALRFKQEGRDAECRQVFETIAEHLRTPDESLAVFALLGARLRLVIHLYRDQLENAPDLLLPPDRFDRRAALIISHVCYDNPMSEIVKVLPKVPTYALECLRQIVSGGEKEIQDVRDYGARLGTHLGFYYWNSLFPDEATANRTLAEFFNTASAGIRSRTIGEIGRIFENVPANSNHGELYERVTKLWDNRFRQIENSLTAGTARPADFHDELSEFIGWLTCECFPLDWRYERVLKAIDHLEKPPRLYSISEDLLAFSAQSERLGMSLRLLDALAVKMSDELRWSVSSDQMKAILRRGLNSTDELNRELALRVQERFLKGALFEYLDLETEPAPNR